MKSIESAKKIVQDKDPRIAKASKIKKDRPTLSIVACLMLAGFSPSEASKRSIRACLHRKPNPGRERKKVNKKNDQSKKSDSPKDERKNIEVNKIYNVVESVTKSSSVASHHSHLRSPGPNDQCSFKVCIHDTRAEETSLDALTNSVEMPSFCTSTHNNTFSEVSDQDTPCNVKSCSVHGLHTRESPLEKLTKTTEEQSSRRSFCSNDSDILSFDPLPYHLDRCDSTSSDLTAICSEFCSEEPLYEDTPKTPRKLQSLNISSFSVHRMPPDMVNQLGSSLQNNLGNIELLENSDDSSTPKSGEHRFMNHLCTCTDTEYMVKTSEYRPAENSEHFPTRSNSFSSFLDEMLMGQLKTFDA
uniref:Uncharacterized protein n=1 Tax=Corethron hystrix TaxID=216773 RepID=A0A7S1BSB2_9STRA|mmetsp:Transcript_36831/g.86008  ORF Transcript_36831/g.86008 Transcript_36831/m.86008 type:complete len:358 (+) Transcript_36831:142-1215(+)